MGLIEHLSPATQSTINDREHVMQMGRYKGVAIDTILFRDPGYLVWMSDKGYIDLDHVIYDEALENAGGRMRRT